MIAAIIAALIRVFHEIIKMESGPALAIAAPAVPAALRDRFADFVRDRAPRGLH